MLNSFFQGPQTKFFRLWCQIVRCQIVRCQTVWCQIVRCQIVQGVKLSGVKLSVVSICPGVKLSYNPVKQSSRSNFGHSSQRFFVYICVLCILRLWFYKEVLLFLYMCAQVVLLDESNIALFAFKITFCHIGGRYL